MFDQLRQAVQRRLDRLTGQNSPPLAPCTNPEFGENLRAKGNAFLADGKLDSAEACFREAFNLNPDDTRTTICLGYVLKEQGRLTEARIILARAINPSQTAPEVFEALYLLGEISESQADTQNAIEHFKSALELKPDFTRACGDVVRILQQQGRILEMRAFLEEQVKLYPDSCDYRLKLAKACADSLDFRGTADNLMAAVALGVDTAPVNMMIGAALCRLEHEEEARPYFEKALATDSSVTHEIHYHKGYFHTRSGNSQVAVEFLEQSIEFEPDYLPSHSLLLLNLSHAATDLNRSYKDAAERFAKAVERTYPQLPDLHPGFFDMDSRVLRIGFMSGEFREHPVYHFLVGILEHIDRTRFELVAFSNNQLDDAYTTSIKSLFSEWHDIKHLDHGAVADLVHTKQIDVLFDLSGHTGDARLPVFSRKPAPVQVAWLGYFASTGLKTMDYIIADEVCVPKDSDEWFSEKIVYIPDTRLCMATPRTSRPIPVAKAPCVTKGYVTFGSFQQAAKINHQVLLVWAHALTAVPQSRLRIQNGAIDNAILAKKLREDMAMAGMDLSRVDLVGTTGWEEYLEAHREVDILLDTFPYPGGTTTALAMWMGVPTITLAGKTMLSLQGASMLECIGLTDWIARTHTEYVDIAKRFACDTDAIVRLRQQLRVIAENSPLFDCKRFATNLEGAIRFMCNDRMASVTAQKRLAALD